MPGWRDAWPRFWTSSQIVAAAFRLRPVLESGFAARIRRLKPAATVMKPQAFSPGLFPWLGVLTLVALMLRLLGNGLESIWYDEAVSLILATTNQPVDLSIWRVHDTGNPAGFFCSCWLWLCGDASIETARTLSAVSGALSVPACWPCCWRAAPPVGWRAYSSPSVCCLFIWVRKLGFVMVTLLRRHRLDSAEADRPAAWACFAALGAILVHLHYYCFL